MASNPSKESPEGTEEPDVPFDVEIGDVLDLHAFHPGDTTAVTVAYLGEARKKGFTIVRIIHGKGIGVKRETVRKVLSECAFVESFKDAPEFSGSWGATIAKLRPAD